MPEVRDCVLERKGERKKERKNEREREGERKHVCVCVREKAKKREMRFGTRALYLYV